MNTTKGQTVIVTSTGKTGVIAGKSRNGAILVNFADGTQARVWESAITAA